MTCATGVDRRCVALRHGGRDLLHSRWQDVSLKEVLIGFRYSDDDNVRTCVRSPALMSLNAVFELQVVVDAEIGDDHICIIYLRDDSHAKIVCETVLKTMTCGEIATLLTQRKLASRFEKDFAVYAVNAKGETVQATFLSHSTSR